MDKIPSNKESEYDLLESSYLLLNKKPLEINQNDSYLENKNNPNSWECSSLDNNHILTDLYDKFRNNWKSTNSCLTFNQLSDINSKDTSNATKYKYLINLNENKNKAPYKESYKEKKDKYDKEDKINKEDIYFSDNLIRRVKKILFDSLMKYDNYIISKVYNNNIGNGLNIKKLLKINHDQIKNTNTIYNQILLKTPQSNIFASDISTRHTNFPIDHNKILIKKLLNEDDEEKRKIFNDLFNMTLSECINHLIGNEYFESLKGLEKFYENELLELNEDEDNKELLKQIINNLEKIFEKKRPRKIGGKKNFKKKKKTK